MIVELAAAANCSSSVSSYDLIRLSRFILPPFLALLKRPAVAVLCFIL